MDPFEARSAPISFYDTGLAGLVSLDHQFRLVLSISAAASTWGLVLAGTSSIEASVSRS